MRRVGQQQQLSISLVVVGGTIVAAAASAGYLVYQNWRRKKKNQHHNRLLSAHEQLIVAGTPLVKLMRLSKLLGRNVYAKMECCNPGGTGKDRAAFNMIRTAERQGLLPPPQVNAVGGGENDDEEDSLRLDASFPVRQQQSRQNGTHKREDDSSMEAQLCSAIERAMIHSRTGGLVVEGTSGSTGIALATLCAVRGHACLVVLPDDQATEKTRILQSLGAVVVQVPTASISNPNHYVNLANKAAQMAQSNGIQAVFMNQFENPANFDIHYQQTGPELWRQLAKIDAFVMSSGTGGTLSGVATFLKEQNPNILTVLVDPPGSSLYHKVEHGVAFAMQQKEQTLRRHRYDTLAEGIGLDRLTHNFMLGIDCMDCAVRVTDQEAVDMAHWILQNEGLWIGSSSAMNLVGAIRTALDLPLHSNVVTMICDGGQRHATRFWDQKFVEDWGLQWPLATPSNKRIPECLLHYNASIKTVAH